MATTEESARLSYAATVGARLRNVRRQKGLSLQGVEQASGREFKVAVLGAYERGVRGPSIERLLRLAHLYKTPLDLLLPSEGPGGARPPAKDPDRDNQLQLDLERLAELGGQEHRWLRSYLRHLQSLRHDDETAVLSIRRGDLRMLAFMFGTTPDRLRRHLENLGVVRAGA